MEDTRLSDDAIEYDEATGSYRVPVAECPADAPSMAVVSFVAALDDVATADLDPLYDSVDPEALDSLHESFESAEGGHVAFPFGDYEITLTAETLSARPIGE